MSTAPIPATISKKSIAPDKVVEEFLGERDIFTHFLEVTHPTADDIWKLVEEEEKHFKRLIIDNTAKRESDLRKVNGLKDFDGPLLFRGVTHSNYGLIPSLHRKLTSFKTVDLDATPAEVEEKAKEIEREILERARSCYELGRNSTAGELLILLQHHFAPTRLLDVSLSPMEALYFACDSGNKAPSDEAPFDEFDGRFFVIKLREGWPGGPEGEFPPGTIADTGLNDLGGHLWQVRLNPRTPLDRANPEKVPLPWSEDKKGDTVLLANEGAIDARIRAQHGVFLCGAISRNSSQRNNYWHQESGQKQEALTGKQIRALSSYPIAFPQHGYRAGKWPAKAWSFCIPGNCKKELRARLEKDYGLTEKSIYPRLDGSPRASDELTTEFDDLFKPGSTS